MYQLSDNIDKKKLEYVLEVIRKHYVQFEKKNLGLIEKLWKKVKSK